MLQLHAVRITVDSIVGVPFTQDPACDTCCVGVARLTVDSVRVGNPEAGAAGTIGMVYASMALLLAIAYCNWSGCGGWQ